MFRFDALSVRAIATMGRISFAGCHSGGKENKLPEMVDASEWTNYWMEHGGGTDNPRVEIFNERTKLLQVGDYLVVKRLNGRGSDTMTLLAIGIIIGRKSQSTLYVAWTVPKLDLVVPLKEVGTISACYTFEDIKLHVPTLVQHLELARDIFLSRNLSVVLQPY